MLLHIISAKNGHFNLSALRMTQCGGDSFASVEAKPGPIQLKRWRTTKF